MPEIRILSIDGGGIRGIIPATILKFLEDQVGKSVSQMFHMITGTSTGGILAVGLSAPDQNNAPKFKASDMIDLYRNDGAKIFSRSFWHGFGSLGGLSDEKYEAKGLEEILKDRLGELKLSQALGDVLVTSYDIEKRSPHFFKSWKARGENIDAGEGETAARRDFLMRDVARATSAAPTYFEPALIKDLEGTKYPLIDGGVYANNPAMCAVASARHIYQLADILIVSLGTGETKRDIPYDEAKNWGLIGWARPLLYVIFDGVSDTVSYQLDQVFQKNHFRFDIDLGGDQDDQDAPNDDMDDARPENIAKLEAKAADLIAANQAELTMLVDRLSTDKDDRATLLP